MRTVTAWTSPKTEKTDLNGYTAFLGVLMGVLGAISFVDGILSLPGSSPIHGVTGDFAMVTGPLLLGFGAYVAYAGIKECVRSEKE